MQDRTSLRFPVKFAVSCEVSGKTVAMQAVNISRGGLLVTGPERFAVGTKVNLRMALGEAGEIELTGLVRHNAGGCGIEFIELSPAQQMRLYLYIDKMETQPKEVIDALEQVRDELRRIERRDWSLWAMTFVVTLLLIVPVFSFSLPAVLGEHDPFSQLHLYLSTRGLLGLVLLYNIYAVYQVMKIKRLRRGLAEKILAMGKLQARVEQSERLAFLDPLTGLYNRRFAELRVPEEIARSRRFKKPLSVLMVDLNEFKPINDRHGHAAGDLVLKEFARQLKESFRVVDVPVRTGGDEFMVILPECSYPHVGAMVSRLEPIEVNSAAQRIQVTFSAGWAQYEEDEPAEQFLERADRALYAAKRNGGR